MISEKQISKILAQVKQAIGTQSPSSGASAPRGKGMSAIPSAVMRAIQQNQSSAGTDTERKKKAIEAAQKAARAVVRPLTMKKGGAVKKATVKAKARKK